MLNIIYKKNKPWNIRIVMDAKLECFQNTGVKEKNKLISMR